MIQVRERGRGRTRSQFLFGRSPSNGGSSSEENSSFIANLQTTLVPSRALGSDTPTYTRATTASLADFEGVIRTALSGEARFVGSRRVRNLLTRTEDLSHPDWVGTNRTITADITDPNGGAKAFTVTATASDGHLRYDNMFEAGDTGINSVYLRRRTGTGTVALRSPANDNIDITSALTTSWQRFSLSATLGGGGIFYLNLTTSGDAVDVAFPMSEKVNGQANQNPSEYVPALATPNKDSNAIGVRYFQHLNANTVASNIVTEATGAAITSAAAEAAGGVTAGVVDASGPLGYLAEGARTNLVLQSQTLGTTWTVSNAADMEAVAADAYVSTGGTTTMDKLQPKATTAVHSLDQAFTFTAAKYTTSADLRYVPATPQRWVALILNDGTTTWGASFDLENGLAGAVSAGATSTIDATALTNVYRVSVTNTANAAAAAGTVKISLNATDTATLESAARAGTETLGVGFVQHEIGAFTSTYIPTTTVAVARNASVDQYVSAGNINATAISLTMQVTPSAALGSAAVFHWASYVDANNYTAVLSDGTNLIARKHIGGVSHDATIAWTRTAGTTAKIGARFDTTNGVDIFLNGARGTPDITATESQIGTSFQIGADGNGANQDYCMHRFGTWYLESLPVSRLQALTA